MKFNFFRRQINKTIFLFYQIVSNSCLASVKNNQALSIPFLGLSPNASLAFYHLNQVPAGNLDEGLAASILTHPTADRWPLEESFLLSLRLVSRGIKRSRSVKRQRWRCGVKSCLL